MLYFLCCTSLPLASTRWVQSTFSNHCPISFMQSFSLTSATSTISSSEIFLGTLGVKPGAAGSGSKSANHCAMLYLSLFVPGNLFLARGVGQTKNRSYDAAENQGERNERDEGEFFVGVTRFAEFSIGRILSKAVIWPSRSQSLMIGYIQIYITLDRVVTPLGQRGYVALDKEISLG